MQEKEECRCVYGQKNIWIFIIGEQGNEHKMGYSVEGIEAWSSLYRAKYVTKLELVEGKNSQ